MSEIEDFDEVLGEGRTRGGLKVEGFDPGLLVFSCMAFLGGALISDVLPAMLCLADGRLNLEGLSLASELLPVGRAEGDAIDIRDREGRRSLDTGCTNSSLPLVEEREGDLE